MVSAGNMPMLGYERMLEEKLRASVAASTKSQKSDRSARSSMSSTASDNNMPVHTTTTSAAPLKSSLRLSVRSLLSRSTNTSRSASLTSTTSQSDAPVASSRLVVEEQKTTKEHSLFRKVLTGEVYQHHPAFHYSVAGYGPGSPVAFPRVR